jgi:hypothetical protein
MIIENAIGSITVEMFTRVCVSMIKRIDICIRNDGGHFQRIMCIVLYVLCSVRHEVQSELLGFRTSPIVRYSSF